MHATRACWCMLALAAVLTLGNSVAALTSLGGAVNPAEYLYHVSLETNNFQFFYNLNPDQELEGCIEGRTTGWVGIGFGSPGQDMIAGYAVGTTVTGSDMTGHTTVVEDAVQDVTFVSGADNGVITTVCFRRAFNTGDTASDVVINWKGTQNLVWARGPAGDPAGLANMLAHSSAAPGVEHGTVAAHSWRGSPQPIAALGNHVDPALFDYRILFDVNNFHVYFNVDGTSLDMCIEARTLGWLGIGWGITGSDYIVGFFGGTPAMARVGDYYGHDPITLDASQDITSITGTQTATITSLCFSRPLAPSDASDERLSKTVSRRWAWGMSATEPATTAGPYTTHSTVTRGAGTVVINDWLLPVEPLGAVVTASNYQHSMKVVRNQYQLWWNLLPVPTPESPNALPTDIQMCIECRTTGWVGLGVGPVTGDDLIVGYVAATVPYVSDYHGHTTVQQDATVDVTLHTPDGGEALGVTTVCFSRKIDTGDSEDTYLNVTRELTAQYAYGTTDPSSVADVGASSHTTMNRGVFTLALDPLRQPVFTTKRPSGLSLVMAVAIGVGGVVVVSAVGFAVFKATRTDKEARKAAEDRRLAALKAGNTNSILAKALPAALDGGGDADAPKRSGGRRGDQGLRGSAAQRGTQGSRDPKAVSVNRRGSVTSTGRIVRDSPERRRRRDNDGSAGSPVRRTTSKSPKSSAGRRRHTSKSPKSSAGRRRQVSKSPRSSAGGRRGPGARSAGARSLGNGKRSVGKRSGGLRGGGPGGRKATQEMKLSTGGRQTQEMKRSTGGRKATQELKRSTGGRKATQEMKRSTGGRQATLEQPKRSVGRRGS